MGAWLTMSQAADHFGLDRHWLTRFVKEHKVPHLRVGRTYRIDPAAIQTALTKAAEHEVIGHHRSTRNTA